MTGAATTHRSIDAAAACFAEEQIGNPHSGRYNR
jgi:hypothetical protein